VIDPRKPAAEALGTAFLVAIVVGSGIMGERLAGGNVAIALLANSTATGAGLAVLILIFGPISGAHLNPAVTLIAALRKEIAAAGAIAFVAAQVAGALAGVAATHVMFELPLFTPSTHVRAGFGQWWSEFIATFGLIFVILSCVKYRPGAVAFAVASYIAAGYWFTASTSFANPAVTMARALTDTFAGIHPANVARFISAQILAAIVAWRMFEWLSGAD
jgi:glycerol uptake facilitator-like aquaporin